MTGAGFAAGDSEIGNVRVEIRSVNGRGLSLKMRLSSACNGFDAAIEERVKSRLARGSVLVVAERMDSASSLPDRQTLSRVAAEMRALADDLQLAQPTLVEVIQAASSGARGESSTRLVTATSLPCCRRTR